MTPSELRDCLRQYLPEQDVLPVYNLFVEFLRSNEVNRKEVRHTDIKEVHEILTCEMIQKMKYEQGLERSIHNESDFDYFSDADPGL